MLAGRAAPFVAKIGPHSLQTACPRPRTACCRRVRFTEGADEGAEEVAAAAAAGGAADAGAAPASGSAFDGAAAEAPALPSRAGVLSAATAAPGPPRRQRLMYTKSGEGAHPGCLAGGVSVPRL